MLQDKKVIQGAKGLLVKWKKASHILVATASAKTVMVVLFLICKENATIIFASEARKVLREIDSMGHVGGGSVSDSEFELSFGRLGQMMAEQSIVVVVRLLHLAEALEYGSSGVRVASLLRK